MKKYAFLILLIVLAPSISQAAWWSPATWFERTRTNPVVPITPSVIRSDIEQKATTSNSRTVETSIAAQNVIVKTVTVADKSVVTENNSLKARIVDLESKLNQCFVTLSSQTKNISATTTTTITPASNLNDPNDPAIKSIRVKEMTVFIQAQIDQVDIEIIKWRSGINHFGGRSDESDVNKKIGELELQKLSLQRDISNLNK